MAEPQLSEDEQLRRSLLAEKHAQAAALLREHGIDCWLTFAREGSDLLLPFVMGDDYLVGMSALMIFADGPSVAVVADYDQSQVDGVFDQVIPYSLDWREPLLATLSERKPARIGINVSPSDHGIDGLTHGLFLTLQQTLQPIGMAESLVPAEPVSSRVRAIKTPAEIERITRSCQITERIFDDLQSMLKPGITESDIHAILVERMQTYEVGPAWEAAWCPSVASSKSKGGHAPPGTVPIERGDAVRVDFGVIHEGYCSDMQRTWYLLAPGENVAAPEIQQPFEAVRDGILLAAELMQPGKNGQDIDIPVRKLIEERGYAFTHALGHQLGRLAHDGGMVLGPDNARYGDRSAGTIEAGMVFTLEPCVGPIGLEEDVVVIEDGVRFLVPPQQEIFLVS